MPAPSQSPALSKWKHTTLKGRGGALPQLLLRQQACCAAGHRFVLHTVFDCFQFDRIILLEVRVPVFS